MTHQELFILSLVVVGVYVWIMTLHNRTFREMMAVLERQTKCLERLSEISDDDDDPERETVPALRVKHLRLYRTTRSNLNE